MSLDLPGFADPVLDSQSSFRAVLEAMSRPGTIQTAGPGLTPPAPLSAAAASVLLSLVDFDTALHLGDDGEAAREWVAFHCGAPWADDSGHADFVWARTMPDLMTLAAGSDDAPQTGATLILEVAGFATGQTLHLAGPGLKEPGMLKVDGLPAAFATIWHANHARFPRGVDIILCAGTELVALPRSLRITSREG